MARAVFKLHFDHGDPVRGEAVDAEAARLEGERIARARRTILRKVKRDREGGRS